MIVASAVSVAAPSAIAVLVVASVPATWTPLGAVAVKPPVKVVLSVPWLPRVTLPALAKVVALVTVPPPSSETL